MPKLPIVERPYEEAPESLKAVHKLYVRIDNVIRGHTGELGEVLIALSSIMQNTSIENAKSLDEARENLKYLYDYALEGVEDAWEDSREPTHKGGNA